MIFNIRSIKLLTFCFIITCWPAFAQSDIKQPINYYQRGQQEETLKSLKKICDKEPFNLAARQMAGDICMKLEKWDEVIDWMKRILELDENNLKARLYMAIAYREKGYFSAFMTRDQFWKKAEDHFQSVVALDSTCNKVLYEYAIFKIYQEKFYDAVYSLKRHLAFFPKDLEAYYKIYFCYDAICYKGDDIEPLKNGRGLALYFYGEYCRQQQQFITADSIFNIIDPFEDTHLSQTAILLSRSKMACQLKQDRQAESYYHQAIGSINYWQDATILLHDMKYVLSDEEYGFYKKIENISTVREFFKRCWLRRNPFPASEWNPRLLEHIRRVLYAEKNYRIVRTGKDRWTVGQYEILEVPSIYTLADRFDDRGVVYIRHGAPNERVDALGGNATAATGVWYENLAKGESWLYKQSGNSPKMIYHFANNSENAVTKLTPILPPAMMRDITHWDKNYFSILSGDADKNAFRDEIIFKNRKTITAGLNSDRHQWPEETRSVNIPCYLAAFSEKNNKTMYEVYYGFLPKLLRTGPDTLDPDTQIDIGFGIYDLRWNEITTQHRSLSVNDLYMTIDSLDIWPDRFSVLLDRQPNIVSFYVNVPELHMAGGHKFRLAPRTFSNTECCMSDLVLASDIQPADSSDRFVRHNLRIVPQPDRTFKKSDPVNIYFELYNLPVNQGNRSEYLVEYKVRLLEQSKKNFLQKITGLFSGDNIVQSAEVERFSESAFSAEFIGLNINNLKPGKYILEINVKIPDNSVDISRSRQFFLL